MAPLDLEFSVSSFFTCNVNFFFTEDLCLCSVKSLFPMLSHGKGKWRRQFKKDRMKSGGGGDVCFFPWWNPVTAFIIPNNLKGNISSGVGTGKFPSSMNASKWQLEREKSSVVFFLFSRVFLREKTIFSAGLNGHVLIQMFLLTLARGCRCHLCQFSLPNQSRLLFLMRLTPIWWAAVFILCRDQSLCWLHKACLLLSGDLAPRGVIRGAQFSSLHFHPLCSVN